MSKEDFLKIQTCTLKVNIHCDGCKLKVKKILHGIEGVYTSNIDAEQGKVIVSGTVDPAIIIKKLNKAGKHAELWGSKNGAQNLPNQLQKLQVDAKSKNNNSNAGKPLGGGGREQKGNPQQQQMPQLNLQQQQDLLQQIKGFKDLKLPQLKNFTLPFQKDPKSVKFDLPPEDSDDGGDFDDGLDDYDDGEDFDDMEGFDDDFDEPTKKPINLPPPSGGNDKKGNNKTNGGSKKGGEELDIPVQIKGGNNNVSKNGGKKGGGGGGGAGNSNQAGGKNGGGGNNSNQAKKGGGNENCSNHQGPNPAMMMDMAQMANMMNHPHMGNIPGSPLQGLPSGGPPPGYFQGMPPPVMASAANPFQQQQYMAALMQQQRMMSGSGDGAYDHHPYQQPMGYARPLPPMIYMAPPPAADPYTHFFSDENANSCSIM